MADCTHSWAMGRPELGGNYITFCRACGEVREANITAHELMELLPEIFEAPTASPIERERADEG